MKQDGSYAGKDDRRNFTGRRHEIVFRVIGINPKIPLKDHFESVIKEHNEMITCLKEKNKDRLKQIIIKHIQTFRERIILFMVS